MYFRRGSHIKRVKKEHIGKYKLCPWTDISVGKAWGGGKSRVKRVKGGKQMGTLEILLTIKLKK